MKTLVLAIGVYALSIWRSAVNIVIAGALYLPTRQVWPLREFLPVHFIRGTIVAVMAPLFIWGISRVPLAEAIVLTFTTPLMVSFLAALFLKEHLHRSSLIGSAVAGLGVLVVAFGEGRSGHPMLLGGAAILGASVCYAANLVLMRHQGRTSTPFEINFFQSVTVAAIWLIIVPIGGLPSLANGWWPWIVASSALTIAVGTIFAWAYARAQASYLVTTEYSGFIWASLFGWLFFHERPSITTVLGGTLIGGGCFIGSMVRRGPGHRKGRRTVNQTT
jgi:S-adenosylmethionine uptake transporter